ncbi:MULTISPECIES: hypothetical protein [unclassified Campylobacter]|uniref:hypothetical protein n=1 Tax=unclassified Campylobacter TaxID=2593542 RepID=UPI003D325F98
MNLMAIISQRANFIPYEEKGVGELLSFVPVNQHERFLDMLLYDTLGFNRGFGNAISAAMVAFYVKEVLGDVAQDEGERLFMRFCNGEDVGQQIGELFSTDELEKIEFLGYGTSFKERIIAKIYAKKGKGKLWERINAKE